MEKLVRIVLKGYKSIKDMRLDVRQMNVFVGANGSGKSNFVSFFKLLDEMVENRLQALVGVEGGAHSILHHGPKTTPQIEAILHFDTKAFGACSYGVRLFHAAEDALIFAEERIIYEKLGVMEVLGAGHRESSISKEAAKTTPGSDLPRQILQFLRACRVYQFHDTSSTSRIRQKCYMEANRPILADAGNLAAVLRRLRLGNPTSYRRIVSTIQQIAPFFDDFVLEPSLPNEKSISLNWHERGSDMIFGPNAISDGTLRAIALITLLLQPWDELPPLLIVDEPELGLHPAAVVVVAALLKQASSHCQVIVATQSPTLLDEFDPADVIVVDREDGHSTFTRQDPERLKDWLEEYSLGELWQKNSIGGGPF